MKKVKEGFMVDLSNTGEVIEGLLSDRVYPFSVKDIFFKGEDKVIIQLEEEQSKYTLFEDFNLPYDNARLKQFLWTLEVETDEVTLTRELVKDKKVRAKVTTIRELGKVYNKIVGLYSPYLKKIHHLNLNSEQKAGVFFNISEVKKHYSHLTRQEWKKVLSQGNEEYLMDRYPDKNESLMEIKSIVRYILTCIATLKKYIPVDTYEDLTNQLSEVEGEEELFINVMQVEEEETGEEFEEGMALIPSGIPRIPRIEE